MTPFPTSDARASILEAASAVFAEQGIDGVSMRQIAREIGVSATALYQHFDSKSALLAAACQAGFAEFGARMEATARAAATPLDALRALGGVYVDFALDHPMHYDVMMVRPHQWALGSRPSTRIPIVRGTHRPGRGVPRSRPACALATRGRPPTSYGRCCTGPCRSRLRCPARFAAWSPMPCAQRADALVEAVIASLT